MPTYEYECEECKKVYDIIQKISDPPLSNCHKCGSIKVKKKISIPTIITEGKTKVSSVIKKEFPGIGDPRNVYANIPPSFKLNVLYEEDLKGKKS